jgi:hypothetical protein
VVRSNVPYKDVDPDSIPKFTKETLRPHGYGTAIYDAVGQTLEAIDTTDPVLVVIYTDGEENSSRSFNEKSVSDASKTAEAKGNFTFLYMGADKAAWGKAQVFGASQANSRDFAATGHLRAMSFSLWLARLAMFGWRKVMHLNKVSRADLACNQR